MTEPTKTQIQALKKLKEEAPAEMQYFLEAAKLMRDLTGLSISGDQRTLQKIQDALGFQPSTKGGQELKRNILRKAKAKSQEGMDGNGWFFIE